MVRIRIPSHLPLVLSFGALSQIGQIVLLRELLMVFHGNELSVGIILGAWMVWVGVGSLLATRLRDAPSSDDTRPSVDALSLLGVIVPLLLPATVFVVRNLRAFFAVPAGAYLSIMDMIVSVFLVTAPLGILLGAQFVLLARAWRRWDGVTDTTGAGKTYIAEALGNAAGGVLFTLLLVNRASSFHAVVPAGIAMAAATLAALHKARRSCVPPLVVLVLLTLSIPILNRVDEWSYRRQWESFSPEHELLSVHQSRYGVISVARRDGQYSFFQSGNLVFTAGGEHHGGRKEQETRDTNGGLFASDLEEQEAVTAAHAAMSQHPDPRRVLLIGRGLDGTLRELLRYSLDHVDYVALDPVLTTAARRHLAQRSLGALDREEVRLVHGDGRLFVKTGSLDAAPDSYDLILVNVPDPATAVLNRYYTKEFFQEAAERLNAQGVLALSVGSTPDLRGTAIANRNATIFHTLKRVFPHVLPVGERTLTYYAARESGVLSADPWTLQTRYLERESIDTAFSPHQFTILFDDEPLRRIGWILRHHGRAADDHLTGSEVAPLFTAPLSEQEALEQDLPPVVDRFFINSDFRPIGYVHTLAYWNTLTRGTPGTGLFWTMRVQSWWAVFPVGLAFLAAAVIRGRKDTRGMRQFAILFAVFTTGLSTMAIQVALLFTFQSVYGFVYEMVGLIVASFMVGLGFGAYAARRFVLDPGDIRVLRTVQLIIAIFAVLIGLALPRIARIDTPGVLLVLFWVMTVVAGALNGFDFPLTTACYYTINRKAEATTGLVYGAELLGSCTGAIVASVMVAPVLGIVACCFLAAIGNATAHVILWIPGRAI